MHGIRAGQGDYLGPRYLMYARSLSSGWVETTGEMIFQLYQSIQFRRPYSTVHGIAYQISCGGDAGRGSGENRRVVEERAG